MTGRVIIGDALSKLKELPGASVQVCVTSPPYWGLRDYGVGGQLGLEKSPQEYVDRMVEVFREVRRVLKDDGTLWLNLGDSYSASGRGGNSDKITGRGKDASIVSRGFVGLPPKNLIGIPWRLAFALQADGWILRQDIVWHKPNAMPESVRDRCTKAHEYIFLLTKSAKYFFDHKAICEPMKPQSIKRQEQPWNGHRQRGMPESKKPHSFSHYGKPTNGLRNKRTVWSVTTKSFKGAHFATFPVDLITPCILAGSRPRDVVLDPFFGAGTTGVAAQSLGRHYVGIEINKDYVNIAQNRLANIQGKLLLPCTS